MKRDRRLVAVLLAALMVASVATLGGAAIGQSATPADATNSAQTAQPNASNETDGWPAPRADAGRTGATSDDGPLPYGNTSWTASNTSGRIGLEGAPDPTVTGDTVVMVYTGIPYDPSGIIEAYNASSGEVRWTQTEVGEPAGSATAADGSVFVATVSWLSGDQQDSFENNSGLYALNATTGEIEWRVNNTFSTPVVADGQVFTSHQSRGGYGSRYGNVTAFDPDTGERLWTSAVQGKVAAYADGRLIVGDEQSETLYALDPDDGSVLWQTGVDGDAFLEGKIAATGDAVYLTNADPSQQDEAGIDDPEEKEEEKTVTAYAATDGTQIWERTVSSGVETTPDYLSAPAVTNGTVYLATRDSVSEFGGANAGAVHALDAQTGAQEWTFTTKAGITNAPVVANGTVYVGGQYAWNDTWELERNESAPGRATIGYIAAFALDATNGNETWNLLTNEPGVQDGIEGSAVADGKLYLTGHDSGIPGDIGITTIESQADRPPWFHRALNHEVEEYNVRPNAEIDASPPSDEDGYYEANTTVTLDASASSDEDGEIVSYEWDLDGDDEFEETGQTIEVTTAAEACEIVTVRLRVTDDEGATDETTVTLQTGPNE